MTSTLTRVHTRRYNTTDKGKKARARASKKYRATPKGREACNRATRISARKRRGCPITEAECAALLKKQGGKCGICRRPLVWPSRGTCVDHDHKTGRVRGVLCGKCNPAIGLFDEKVANLERAIVYLKRRT